MKSPMMKSSDPNLFGKGTTLPYPLQKRYVSPAPNSTGTVCLLIGLLLAYVLFPTGQTPAEMARIAAVIVGIALLIDSFFDSLKGLYNLFRADLLCLIALYGLTLVEFLFPQEAFSSMVDVAQATRALNMVLLAMAGLALGRHLIKPKPKPFLFKDLKDVSNKTLFLTVLACAFLGFFYMLLTVQFNPLAMIDEMIAPRFSQPWSRVRLGGWLSFLTEMTLFCYAIPPLTGVIWNRQKYFPTFQKLIVFSIFALTMFQGFASGTRNIFVAYVITFLTAYLITLPKLSFKNAVLPIIATMLISSYLSYHMLEFRAVGIRNYISNQGYSQENTRDTFFVDYNLMSLAPVISAFPKQHSFLGSEVIIWALVKPIPRALWPNKPEGLSTSIEEIVGAEGWTVATTYVGESYMMAGWFGVLSVSLFLGALAAWWNRRGMRSNSDYSLVVYALGFFAAAITMRSLFWLTTAMLPVIGLMLFKKLGFIR